MRKPLVFILFLLTGCTSLFYHPDRVRYSHPSLFRIKYNEVWFKSQDGTELCGWHLINSSKQTKGLIIFFHGNAQNMSAHFRALAWLTKEGYDLFIPDYRGYGLSDGSPSPDGVYLDSLAIMSKGLALYKENHYKKLVLYGQSLGGAVGLRAYRDFKQKNAINLLVLDSTFMSYKDVAWDFLTGNWLTFLFAPLAILTISDKYAVSDYIAKIKTPTLVIHSKTDRIVPFEHGQSIYSKLTTPRKWFWQLEATPHIGAFFRQKSGNRARFLTLLDSI